MPSVPSVALDATSIDTTSPHGGAPLALDATMAAPLPVILEDLPQTRATLSMSVLPRVEQHAEAVRLVPTDGPRYATSKVLGAGGMGEVALADDRDIGRKVALKRLHAPTHSSGNQSPAVLARFVDEVRTVGQLEHPNIVPIHDVGVDEKGNFFFVMKYLDGATLENIIDDLKAGKPEALAKYPIRRRMEIFVGVIRALEYAHARGIIHRDIKPANVMVGHNGEVVLMDWGVARPIQRAEADAVPPTLATTDVSRASATHAGALIGTPLYMSPEQAMGKNSQLDERSDLYAACQMLYELLSLHHRFEDKDSLVLLLAAIQSTTNGRSTGEFAAQHLAPAQVPPDLRHFLRKGLALDPKDRWQSASEIIHELGMMADGRCRVQCPATLMKRSAREFTGVVDKSPGTAVALVASLAMSVVGLVGVAVYGLVT